MAFIAEIGAGAARGPAWTRVAILSTILLGVVLRIWLFTRFDSLWRDESSMLLAIHHRPWAELAAPLEDDQKCPVLLAVLYKALLEFLPVQEAWLKVPGLGVSLAALPLLASVLVRLGVSASGRFAVVSMAAVSPGWILFSCQAKPYAFDILASLLLVWHGLRALERPGSIRDAGLLAFISAFCVSMSFAALFVAGSLWAALVLAQGRRSARSVVSSIVAVALLTPLAFVGSGPPSPYMAQFWKDAFPRAEGGWWIDAAVRTLSAGFLPPLVLGTVGVAVVSGLSLGPLALLGTGRLLGESAASRTNQARALLLLLPIPLALAASALHRYPFAARTLLFSSPLVLLVAGLGWETVRRRAAVGRIAASVLFGGAVLTFLAVDLLSFGRPVAGVGQALERARRSENPGDVIVCDLFAAPTLRLRQEIPTLGPLPVNPIQFEWILASRSEGRPSPEEIVTGLADDRSVHFIAERAGYHRTVTGRLSHPAQKLLGLLEAERQEVGRLEGERAVWVKLERRAP